MDDTHLSCPVYLSDSHRPFEDQGTPLDEPYTREQLEELDEFLTEFPRFSDLQENQEADRETPPQAPDDPEAWECSAAITGSDLDDAWAPTDHDIVQPKQPDTFYRVYPPDGPCTPREPENIDRLAARVTDGAYPDFLTETENFIKNASRLENRLSDIQEQVKQGRWSYPGSVASTPEIPEPVLVHKPVRAGRQELKDIVHKLRGELARIVAEMTLLEENGVTVDDGDMQVMMTAFSAFSEHLDPLSSEDAASLKMASMRLNLKAMEVQVAKYQDAAQQCRDIVDTMRRGFQISRTAHQVSLRAANELYEAHLHNIRHAYPESVKLADSGLPKGLCTRLKNGGCDTLESLALLSADDILAINEIGPGSLEKICNFFVRKNLPALSLVTRHIADVVPMNWRSVNSRNQDVNYRWEVPKCYGNLFLAACMDGRSSSVFLCHAAEGNQ